MNFIDVILLFMVASLIISCGLLLVFVSMYFETLKNGTYD